MPETHEDAIDLIGKWGLKTAPGRKRVQNINEAVKYHHGSEARRDELDYEIDGIVIKVNRYAYHKELGLRTTTPRWAVAYKFEPRKEITRVEDIVIQVGRTGILTPVAFLMPVEVGGVTVSRANLHNMDEIARLGVKIGDYVKVQRAGDVIPDVVEVITPRRTGGEKEFHMPGKCPSCGAGVEKEDVFYRCPAGLSCPAQVKEAVIHYSSKGAADIAGFSDATCAQFYEADLVKRISDIYILKKDDILKLEGWKDKKADNLLAAIERSKAITLDRFIYGLGIRNVGKHIGSLLAEKMGSLEKLMKATVDEMTGIKEIGPETAKSVADFFSARNNAIEVGKLIEYGVKVNPKALKGKLAGKKIVFTGSLRSMERSQAEKIVADEGGEALSSVSSGTDFVVAGEKAGSKVDSARKKGIRVISEEEFLSLIGKDAFNTSLF
jgi:DNA ligase (NAD+)